MKGQKFLKVTSILMIIGGVLGAIVSLMSILGVGALTALAGSAEGMGLLYVSLIVAIVDCVIEFIAGIKGVGACSDPRKAEGCMIWGILVAVLCIVSMILGMVGGGKFSITSLILNLVVPALYIFGAVQMKNEAAVK